MKDQERKQENTEGTEKTPDAAPERSGKAGTGSSAVYSLSCCLFQSQSDPMTVAMGIQPMVNLSHRLRVAATLELNALRISPLRMSPI